MVDRVLMNAAGLKIAPAGVSVHDAAFKDLLFDSTGAQLNIVQRGVARSYASGPRSDYLDIPFNPGLTFDAPPLGFFGLRLSHDPDPLASVMYSRFGTKTIFYRGRYTEDYYPNNKDNTYWWATVFTMIDRIRCQWWYNSDNSLFGPPKSPENITYYYTIVDYAS